MTAHLPVVDVVRVPLDADLLRLKDAAAARGLAPLDQITPEEARERVRAGAAACAAGPELAVVEDVGLAVADGTVAVRRYLPATGPGGRGPLLMYLHGGGWVTGDLDYADALCRLAARDVPCEVVSVDYPLSPEHPYPAAADVCYAVLRHLADAGRGRPLLVGGDSAGGALAAGCAHRAGRDGIALAGQLLVYPVTDHDFGRDSYVRHRDGFPIGRASMRWFWDLYAPPSLRDEASPLRSPDPALFPPTAVVVAGHDPLRDEGVAFARRLSAAGVAVELVEYARLAHGFLRFTAAAPAARDAQAAVVRLLRHLLSPEKDVARS